MNKYSKIKTKGKPREALSEIDLGQTAGKLSEPDLTTEEGKKEARERELDQDRTNAEIATMRRGREIKG